jgi:hypothetical protein
LHRRKEAQREPIRCSIRPAPLSSMPSMFEDGEGVRQDDLPEGGEIIQPSPEELEHIDLYFGGLSKYPDLPILASRWLEELTKKGLSPEWRKQSRAYDYQLGAPETETHSIRLENGQTLSLVLFPWGIEVLEDHSRTDLAILGALAPLEAGEADVALIRRTLSSIGGSIDEALRELDDPERRREQRMLEFAVALLRYYRPNFDSLPPREQRQLAVQTCERLDEVSKAERKLAETLEFGTGHPRKKVRSAVKDAALDVKLAEIHDLRGSSYVELGQKFGIPQTKHDELKGDNQAVRKKVERGRKLLNEAFDGGWEAEVARRRSDSRTPREENDPPRNGDRT